MTLHIRNQYQMFLISALGLSQPEEFFELGKLFADLENEFHRPPTAWEVVCAYKNK